MDGCLCSEPGPTSPQLMSQMMMMFFGPDRYVQRGGSTGRASEAGGETGASGKLTHEDSPLDKYMSAAYGDSDEEKAIADSKKAEESTAACMAAEGFDYIPVDQSQNMSSFDAADITERDTEAWVAANGYGMTQNPEDMAAQQEESESSVEPNQDYVASLSQTEQNAFYAVLHGPQQTEGQALPA